MGEKNLKENLEFISENKEHLLKEHKNKFLLVFKKKLAGSYDSYEQAAKEGVRLFGVDAEFLVYHLVEEEPLNFVMEAIL